VLPRGPQAETDGDGKYIISDISSGNHDFVASKTEYDAKSILGVFVADKATVNIDFVLGQTLGGCENDCTAIGSNLCDPICHGRGTCWFYDKDTMAACDGTFGVIEAAEGPYEGKYIDCCEGGAYNPVKADDVKVGAENVVVIKKPVLYKGNFVNMVIVVFRK
jgi:hypothetical protein